MKIKFHKNKVVILVVCVQCVLFVTVHAQHPWFSKKINQHEQVITNNKNVSLKRNVTMPERLQDDVYLIDVVVSYYNDPPGDNDGNFQDETNLSKRDRIEKVLQYFAMGVYEATEGIHRIRTIRIYTNGEQADKCDIKWCASSFGIQQPFVNAGIASTKGCINFLDEFYTPYPTKIVKFTPLSGDGTYPYETNVKVGGFALTHEWGHYYYGVYDEYEDNERRSLHYSQTPQPALMNRVLNSLFYTDTDFRLRSDDYKWLNFSVAYQGGEQNGKFAPYENTKMTRQHAIMGGSCWETLCNSSTRVSGNPLGKRTFYPEFRNSKKTPTKRNNKTEPTLNIVDLAKTKELVIRHDPSDKNSFNIIWMANSVVALVLDRSGSMSDNNRLDTVKTEAKHLIDKFDEGVAVGILAFDGSVTTIQSIMELTDANRSSMKQRIDSISPGGATAIGDASRAALNMLLNYGVTNRTAVTYLLTDGENNTGEEPANVIPDYVRHQIPIYSYAYELEDVSTVAEMSRQTGGTYTWVSSREDLQLGFNLANQDISSRVIYLYGKKLPSGAASSPVIPQLSGDAEPVRQQQPMRVAQTETLNIPFAVDPSMKKLWLSVTYTGGVNDASLVVESSDANPTTYTAVPEADGLGNVALFFEIEPQRTGVWHLKGTCQASTRITYFGDATIENGKSYFLDAVIEEEPDNLDTVLVSAYLNEAGPVASARVTGRLELGHDTLETQEFDEIKPGMYQARFQLDHGRSGFARIVVEADNLACGAYMSWSHVCIHEIPPDVQVPDQFTRVAITETSLVLPNRLYVRQNGNDANNGLSWNTAKRTIQGAVNAAQNGALVAVDNGTYGAFNSSNKTMVIRSLNGPDVTFVNGGGVRCATLGSSPEHVDTHLIGFTLQNGNASSAGVTVAPNYGGGATFGTLENCLIQNNSATIGGGTYYGVLKNCTVSGNTATSGGGAYLSVLDRCVVSGNTASDKGGGLYQCEASNSLLRGNTGSNGGGSHSGTLVNCTVLGNIGSQGAGSHSDIVRNSIVWANTQVGGWPANYRDGTWSHSCTTPLPAGEGNIDQDPQFYDSFGRLAGESPCVETGENSHAVGDDDLDGNCRIERFTINMGAYEGFQDTWVLHVDANHGNNSQDGKSWATAKQDIQAALTTIPTYASGTIYVTNGVYGPISIYNSTKRVRIEAVSGNPADTVIDGGYSQRCATLVSSVFSDASDGFTDDIVLAGFTLRNGKALLGHTPVRGGNGGGVTGGKLVGCVISGCEAEYDGGGAYWTVLENCILTNNTAVYGGGALETSLMQCLVVGNSASDNGGGAAESILTQCTVAANYAVNFGGGVYGCIVHNSIVWDNEIGNQYYPDRANHVYSSCNFSCSTPSMSVPYGQVNGNITGDPLFVDPYHGDYRLQTNSPCIDAGDNHGTPWSLTCDLDGNPRLQNGTLDMGVYEGALGLMTNDEVLYVDAQYGDDTNNGHSWVQAKRSIQAAMDIVHPYGRIYVTNGVYAPVFTRGKPMTVQAVSGNPEDTTIDGGGTNRCATLTYHVDNIVVDSSETMFSGFTFRNGNGVPSRQLPNELPWPSGGGVLGGVLSNCVVIANTATGGGGGAACSVLVGCIVRGNQALIFYNEGYGGGASSSTLIQCLITGNEADWGGGSSTCELINCTMVGNISRCSGSDGGASFGDIVKNSIIWGNTKADGMTVDNYYRGGMGFFTSSCTWPMPQNGVDNIVDAPCFENPLLGDYRLRSISPCIDAGDNRLTPVWLTADLNGKSRAHNGMIDMGAYESQRLDEMFASVYVSPDGDDENHGLSLYMPKRTLQAGVDAVMEGGTVYAAAGVYEPFSVTNRVIRVQALSTNPSDTTIDGGMINRCATLAVLPSVSQTNTSLVGFTLVNGNAIGRGLSAAGGGVVGGTIINCFVKNCTAEKGGGAAYTKLVQCVLGGNTAVDSGGGAAYADVMHCTITANGASSGGGLYESTAVNSIVWGNIESTNNLPDNYIDSSMTYSCSRPLPQGTGNIDADPDFMDNAGDYRLQTGSSCVNTGAKTLTPSWIWRDLNGNKRIDGVNVDMGVFEGEYVVQPDPNNTVLYVDAVNGSNGNSGENWNLAKRTLRAAVDAMYMPAVYYGEDDIGTIHVAPGVYEPLESPRKPIFVQAFSSDPADTIIDGQSVQRCVTVTGVDYNNGWTLTFSGFTLQNGYAASGGAVHKGKFINCIFKNNVAENSGGAASNARLIQCLLVGNTAGWDGGGADNSILTHCTVSGNYASGLGGGVVNSVVINSIVWNNQSASGNAYNNHCGWGEFNYSCTTPQSRYGTSSILVDPQFVDPATGDYRLQATSPCIDRGGNGLVPSSLLLDFFGSPRVDGLTVDMGFYEFQSPVVRHMVIYVSPDGNDANNGEFGAMKQSLQGAIEAVADNGIVYAMPGIYQPIVTHGKRVSIVALSDEPFDTVIEGGGMTRCATLGYETARGVVLPNQTNTVLIGFVLRNGFTTYEDNQIASSYGGGVLGGRLINCHIENCVAEYGGGVYASTLDGCTLYMNSAFVGAGGFASYFVACKLINNFASGHGGGAQGSTLMECDLLGNYAVGYGGGALNSHAYQCALVNNVASSGYGIYGGDAINSRFMNDIFKWDDKDICCGVANKCSFSTVIDNTQFVTMLPMPPVKDSSLHDTITQLSNLVTQVPPPCRYVDKTNGNDLNSGISLDMAKSTLCSAIDELPFGGILFVSSGIYHYPKLSGYPFNFECIDGKENTYLVVPIGTNVETVFTCFSIIEETTSNPATRVLQDSPVGE